MFCPKCGEGEQQKNSYCRRCGELLSNTSDKLFWFSGIFGGSLDRQININIFVSLTTVIFGGTLIGFLLGYYEAEPFTPKIIYLIYLFICLITVWQTLSVIVSLQMKSKFNRRGNKSEENTKEAAQKEIPPNATRDLLPEADTQNLITSSITENTTKKLAVEKK